MNDDVEILQEILDSEPVVKALGAPIDARKAAEAVRRLRSLAGTNDGAGVSGAFNALTGALGGRLMASLLSGPEWRSFCPINRPLDDYDADDHSQVVWLGQAQRVIGRAIFDGETFLGVKFDCEPI